MKGYIRELLENIFFFISYQCFIWIFFKYFLECDIGQSFKKKRKRGIKWKKSIGKLIMYLSRCIQQELKNVVVPFDISVGEEPYYMALTRNDGLTQDELTKTCKSG